jgi:hypothetical protein
MATAIQVIPVGLFTGFTRFHGIEISPNNAAHSGACVPVSGRKTRKRVLPLSYEPAGQRVSTRTKSLE